MGLCIYFDIVNFISLFLLIDLINGINNRFLTKKFRSGVLTIVAFSVASFVISFGASFLVFTKVALLAIIALTFLVITLLRKHTEHLNKYEDVECGKEAFFSQKKVMFFVPHEDDDINLAGGIIEQYIKYDSDVYIVFATNGDGDTRCDMQKIGFTRIKEAIKALGMLKVPEKNIFFLGYGDGWSDDSNHIYNAQPDVVKESKAGKTHTYGIENHSAYHNDIKYTYSNYYNDIKQVILEHKPDVIYCIDYDTHPEHRALSMLFEKVMGDILKTTVYKPVIYKGFGYRTAWNSAPDFSDSFNIKSTVSCLSANDIEIYDWDKRVRVPIDVTSIRRSLEESKLYQVLSLYASQRAVESAGRIINGDKVFWKRRSDSLLYDADISVSSGNVDKLTDFMLLDCNDLMRNGERPYDGVWCPDDLDDDKLITVKLNAKVYVSYIALYDNPSPDDNILNAVIKLDDGTIFNTGKLNPCGDATIIPVDKQIQSFTVKIDKYEGENIGLCEIEAYSSDIDCSPVLYKLTDDNDNFVYDYIVPLSGEQVLKIYSDSSQKSDIDSFILRCNNKKCLAEIHDENIFVKCPIGQKCQIELLSKDNHMLDRVLLRNLTKMERYLLYNRRSIMNNRSYFSRLSGFVQKALFR